MYDFIKLRITNFDPNLIKEYKDADSIETTYSKRDLGEVYCTKVKTKNITLTLFKSGYAEIKGSWHKFFNDGINNYTDFKIDDFSTVNEELSDFFKIDLFKCRIITLETGINLHPPVKSKSILQNLLSHRKKMFSRQIDVKKNYYEVRHQRYYVKIYDKAIQYDRETELLRFELKHVRMHDLKKHGIIYLHDLIKPECIKYLTDRLIHEFSYVLMFDPTIRINELSNYQRTQKIHEWNNPNYWRELTKQQTLKQKKVYKAVVQNHSDQVQNKLTVKMLNKLAKLTEKGIPINRTSKPEMVTNYYIDKGLNSPPKTFDTFSNDYDLDNKEKRVCKTCGTDISHRRKTAKFCDKKKCRNIDSNPRNNIKRSIERMLARPSLFDLEPFIKVLETKYNFKIQEEIKNNKWLRWD